MRKWAKIFLSSHELPEWLICLFFPPPCHIQIFLFSLSCLIRPFLLFQLTQHLFKKLFCVFHFSSFFPPQNEEWYEVGEICLEILIVYGLIARRLVNVGNCQRHSHSVITFQLFPSEFFSSQNENTFIVSRWSLYENTHKRNHDVDEGKNYGRGN